MLRRALAFGPAVLLLLAGLWIGPKYDRYVLPAFDGFVYDAMADNPRVFTLAPWGYRIAGPWIVHLLPVSSGAVGYYFLTLLCLAGAVWVVGRWLRDVGFTDVAAGLGALAFAFSTPVREMLGYQVLVDPLALLITALTLRELRAPRVPVLMALIAAGALTKEACLVPAIMAPVMFVAGRGWKRGLMAAAASIGPGVGLAIMLRMTWGAPQSALSTPILDLIGGRWSSAGRELAFTALLSGLLFPVLIGLARERSVVLRVQGVSIWFVTFATILANPYHFSVPDLPRLSGFAWPALLPLALVGAGFVREPRTHVAPARKPWTMRLSGIVLMLCLTMVSVTDPYRHAPDDARNDPIRYLARNRESLKTARLLDEGGALTFDAEVGRFAGPIAERFNLTEGRRHRWFLFAGFGKEAAYEAGLPQFEGEASLLIPILNPRDVAVSIELDAPLGTRIEVGVGERALAVLTVEGAPAQLRLPGTGLRRGGNLLTLRGPEGVTVGLRRFEAKLIDTPR